MRKRPAQLIAHCALCSLGLHIRHALTEKRLFVAVIQCGPLPQVHHGKVEGTDHSWGAGASYSCFHGYQQSAPAVLTCEGNGTWTGDVPQCLRKLPPDKVSLLFSLSCRDILQSLYCARVCVCVSLKLCCVVTPALPAEDTERGTSFPTGQWSDAITPVLSSRSCS